MCNDKQISLPAGVNPILGALACCVGSLFFSYFNDSYFWVVNRTLGVGEVKDQIATYSITSTIARAVGFVEVLILSIFL
jgi:GntP family gluconate:H+ symporter|uniref:GntT/GntP/DsdX family permease n=1 Tax=Clostridium sp. NkU-1 TaxID=1095009 RepID=UPI0006D12615